jgi:hypothetical protein
VHYPIRPTAVVGSVMLVRVVHRCYDQRRSAAPQRLPNATVRPDCIMTRIATLLLVLLSITAGPATPQQPAPRPAAQIADSSEIAALAHRLTSGARTDSARAAVIYEWVARNVEYDARSFLRGTAGHLQPETVFRHRLAVCGGYVALYARLAREAGLVTEEIHGYAKGVDHRHGQSTRKSNHAWLAVRIGGSWRLVDPTWGAGVFDRNRFVPQFSWDWFFTPPDVLVLSHFPEATRWQLVAPALRRAEFERMPAVPRAMLNVGFAPAAIRSGAVAGSVRDFPVVGARESRVRVVNAPLAGTIRRSTSIALDLVWPGAADVAVISGGVWTPLERRGERFSGSAVAGGSQLYVAGRTDGSAAYETLLLYQVR